MTGRTFVRQSRCLGQLLQLTAAQRLLDLIGRNRLVLAGPVEATVLGNVLIQARACGEISSLAELRKIVRATSDVQTFEPKAGQEAAWQEARDRFATLRQKGARRAAKTPSPGSAGIPAGESSR